MQRPRPGLGAELVPLILISAALAGTTALVIQAHRQVRDRDRRRASIDASVVASVVEAQQRAATQVVVAPPPPKPTVVPQPPPAPAPAPLPKVDPTARALEPIRDAEAAKHNEKDELDAGSKRLREELERKRAEAAARQAVVARTKAELKPLADRADRLEVEAARASIELDVLERKREENEQLVAINAGRSSYAVLPHKGPNGTWRRPIVIECHDGSVSLRPSGPTFGLGELLEFSGFGNSTFRGLVAREAIRVQRGESPDGRDVVPYFYFLIRPDGIKSYYAARKQLEPLGIAFGYELADADWEVEFPDLDDPSTWIQPPENDPQPPSLEASPSPADTPGSGTLGAGAPGLPAGSVVDSPFVWRGRPDLPEPPGAGADPGGEASTPSGLPDRPLGSAFLGPQGDPALAGGTGRSAVESGPAGSPDLGGMSRPGASGRPRTGTDDLPAGLGEEVASKTESEREWLRKLAERNPGASVPPGLGGLAPSSITETLAENGLLPGLDRRNSDLEAWDPSKAPGRPEQAVPRRLEGESRPGSGTPGGPRPAPGQPGSPDAAGLGAEPGNGPSGGGNAVGSGLDIGRVERFELVIACEPRGVAIHPGDYRVTLKGLAAKEPLLAGQLRALLESQRNARPGKVVVPSIRYVVEPGGHSTYSTARIQLALEGIDWPSTLQVSGGDVLSGLSREDW